VGYAASECHSFHWVVLMGRDNYGSMECIVRFFYIMYGTINACGGLEEMAQQNVLLN
jgi:hypothetical protein